MQHKSLLKSSIWFRITKLQMLLKLNSSYQSIIVLKTFISHIVWYSTLQNKGFFSFSEIFRRYKRLQANTIATLNAIKTFFQSVQ
jgi:hypothetical protein